MKKIFFIFCFIVLWYNQTYAIPPPDFIIQVTSQLWIWFAMWAALFTTLFWTSFVYLKEFYKKNKILISLMIIALLISGWTLYKHLSDEEKKANAIIALELKNYNIDKWLSYKDINVYNKYKDLSFDEKVQALLKIEWVELNKWLFDGKVNNIEWKSFSNEEFLEVMINKNTDYVFLDARENIEYEIWHIPWVIHHRVADLKADNKWKELNKNKVHIVICWSWVRWKQVSEFLLSKWVNSVFLKWWVEDWVKFWWTFDGKTELKDVYWDTNFRNYLDDLEFTENILSWTKIIDAREITRLKKQDTLENSDNISIMYNTSSFLEKKFNKYNENDDIIVICNEYINCFDAQLVWLELQKRWADFLGIYYKKWVVD